MRLVMTGGGSGGHVSPIAAVASEIKQLQPDAEIHYIGQYGDRVRSLLEGNTDIAKHHSILAGKFRRYHGVSWWKQLFDLPTLFFNLRDIIFVAIGIIQAIILMVRVRPTAVFVKGGFVGLPVGIAAKLTGRPIVTHDSDVLPGLTNRVVGKWARFQAVGMADSPYYPYPKETMRVVGVPVSADHKPVNAEVQLNYKQALGLPVDRPLVFVIGGGLGAKRINEAMAKIAPEVVKLAEVVHVAGHKTGEATKAAIHAQGHDVASRYDVKDFIDSGLYRYTGAADVIVSRPGATSMAEFGSQQKAVIIVPNPLLSEGHQLKNAEVLSAHKAVLVVPESHLGQHPEELLKAIQALLNNPKARSILSSNLHQLTKPGAAHAIAELILEAAKS